MFVTMYNFSKRENSTKRPTEAYKTISGDVCFKNTTSLLTPTIIWAVGHEDNVEGDDSRTDDEKAMVTNYCEMNGKYYYVTDVRRVSRNHIEFDCRMDLLATYKNEILSTTAYVEYSDSHGRVDIVDPRAVSVCDEECFSEVTPHSLMDNTGCYALTVIDKNNTKGSGFVATYILNEDNMSALSTKLNDPNFIDWAIQYFTNPFEAITRCVWLPVSYSKFDNTILRPININSYDTGVSGIPLSVKYVSNSTYFKLPWLTDDYRRVNLYTKISIHLPFIGLVDIPVDVLVGEEAISIDCAIDPAVGSIVYRMSTSSVEMGIYSGTCGYECPLSKTSALFGDRIAGALSIIGSAIAFKSVSGTKMAKAVQGGIVASSTYGISQWIGSASMHTQINGTLGSRVALALGDDFRINIFQRKLSEEVTAKQAILGLPCGETLRLSNLSGYCQTVDASVDCSATLEHKQEINSYLNGGVYLE